MKTINSVYLKELVHDILFENTAKINLPVDGGMYKTNSRMSMYDRPGPDIPGRQSDEEILEDDDLPLAPSEVISNQSLIQIDFDPQDKEFLPDNKHELSSAMSAYLAQIGSNDLEKDEIQKMWKNFTDILDKVK